jgi:hypothetical protein
MNPKLTPSLVTLAEYSRISGVSRRTLTKWCAAGEIGCTKIGGTWMIAIAPVPQGDVPTLSTDKPMESFCYCDDEDTEHEIDVSEAYSQIYASATVDAPSVAEDSGKQHIVEMEVPVKVRLLITAVQ